MGRKIHRPVCEVLECNATVIAHSQTLGRNLCKRHYGRFLDWDNKATDAAKKAEWKQRIGCPLCPTCGDSCGHTTIGGIHANPLHRCFTGHEYGASVKEVDEHG